MTKRRFLNVAKPCFVVAVSSLAILSFVPAAWGLALSRGEQVLDIPYTECLKRSYAAFVAEGYNAQASQGASFTNGFKGPHGAYITCNPLSPNQMVVNVFVASEGTQDGGAPGSERTRLQQRMSQAAVAPPISPPIPPVTPPRPSTGKWTEWINRDDPGGAADWEALAEMRGQVPCAKPVAIECRVRSDKRDWRAAGQRYKCDLNEPNPGGICINAENQPGGCLDYEVRYLCP